VEIMPVCRNRIFASLVMLTWLFATRALPAGPNEYDCVVEPGMVVELSSQVDGIIESMLVERGDRVEANQVVARLESGAEAAAVEQAQARAAMEAEIRSLKASLAYDSRNATRLEELHKKGSISADDYDRAKTESRIAFHKLKQAEENKRLAELELGRAEATLKLRTIHSPISGVVADRYLNPGEAVSVVDRPIVKIAQIDPLRVEVVLPVAEFGRVAAGQRAMVRPEAASGGPFESTVKIVDPIIDAASGTFRVTLSLPNPEGKLTSGLRCQVSFLDQASSNAAAPGNGAGADGKLSLATQARAANRFRPLAGTTPGARTGDH
jgi:RND family efflux transporter MFP subunit